MAIDAPFRVLARASELWGILPDTWEFERPEFLALLLLVPIWGLVAWPRVGGGVFFARGDSARRLAGGWGVEAAVTLVSPLLFRSLALAAFVLALAHPIRTGTVIESALDGGGIALAVDLSSSMLALDMEGGRDRITVAREAAVRFAESRPLDELTLVGFAGESLTRVPPTRDPGLVSHGARSLEIQLVRDGTDISAALLTSGTRLLESDREPRVVILLTDGAHNGTGVPPLTAARALAATGVRVHAVSILGPEAAGRSGSTSLSAIQARVRMEDEMRTVLRGVAEITGGEYFHASSGAALDSVYAEIDRLEPPVVREIEREERTSQRGVPLLAGLLFLGIEGLLRGTRWGLIP